MIMLVATCLLVGHEGRYICKKGNSNINKSFYLRSNSAGKSIVIVDSFQVELGFGIVGF